MIIQAKFSAIKGIKLHEWTIRFVFCGLVCVLAGLIAQHFGPTIGGFFLAFPAIFPAGASLVKAHERQHKRRAGFDGAHRGRIVAAIDALGATIGCIGLAGFALVFYIWLPRSGVVVTFILATLVWLTVAIGTWFFQKRYRLNKRRRSVTAGHEGD